MNAHNNTGNKAWIIDLFFCYCPSSFRKSFQKNKTFPLAVKHPARWFLRSFGLILSCTPPPPCLTFQAWYWLIPVQEQPSNINQSMLSSLGSPALWHCSSPPPPPPPPPWAFQRRHAGSRGSRGLQTARVRLEEVQRPSSEQHSYTTRSRRHASASANQIARRVLLRGNLKSER